MEQYVFLRIQDAYFQKTGTIIMLIPNVTAPGSLENSTLTDNYIIVCSAKDMRLQSGGKCANRC